MDKMIIRQEALNVGGTGEIDGRCYQKRADSLLEFAKQLCGDINDIYFHDMVVSWKDFVASLRKHGKDENSVEIAGSAVMKEPKHGTKAQLHKPFNLQRAPEWFNFELAGALEAVVVPGYTAFSKEELKEAVIDLLENHPKVRIKLATGSSGEGQTSVVNGQNIDELLGKLGNIDWETGVVVEKDLGKVVPISVTLLQTSKGIFTSIGTILEEPAGAEMHYLGTTAVVTPGMPEDLISLGIKTITINDPIHEQVSIEISENALRVAQKVFEAYKSTLEINNLAVLPRINIDLLATEDGSVYFVDPSLRIGGSSGNELIGAINCLERRLNLSVSSTRTIIGRKADGAPYRQGADPVITLFDDPSPDIYPDAETVSFFVIEHNTSCIIEK